MQRNDCGSCSYCRGRRTEEGGRASGTAQPCAGKETRARLARRPGLRAGDERHRVERSNGAARPISRDAPLPRRRRPRPRRPRPARSGRSPGRTAGWPGWASGTASPRAAARGRPEPPWWGESRPGPKRVRRGGNARTTVACARGVTAATGAEKRKALLESWKFFTSRNQDAQLCVGDDTGGIRIRSHTLYLGPLERRAAFTKSRTHMVCFSSLTIMSMNPSLLTSLYIAARTDSRVTAPARVSTGSAAP